MISTVTVSTITTISTVTTSSVTTTAALGMAAALSIAAAITLIGLLTTKELVSIRGDSSSQRIGRFLSVGITPLLMVFVALVAITIAGVL